LFIFCFCVNGGNEWGRSNYPYTETQAYILDFNGWLFMAAIYLHPLYLWVARSRRDFPTFNLYYLCFLLSALADVPGLHLRSPGFISSPLSVGRPVGWPVGLPTPPQPAQDYDHVLASAVVVTQPLNCVLAFVAFSTAFLWFLQLRFSSWVSNNIIGIEGFSQRTLGVNAGCRRKVLRLIFGLHKCFSVTETLRCKLLNNIFRLTSTLARRQTKVCPSNRGYNHWSNSIQYWSLFGATETEGAAIEGTKNRIARRKRVTSCHTCTLRENK